ncbi:hypothetical protein ACOJQI_11165 [Bacillus salacetis]|uniref:hypothetical protein n=1 Tax=Bacillus salacetis TaxID=2315464 RepID=UPI003BA02533
MKEEGFDSQIKELLYDDFIPSMIKERMDEAYKTIEQEKKKPFFSINNGVRASLFGTGLIGLTAVGVIASQGFQLVDSKGEVIMSLTESEEEIKEWDLEQVEAYKEQVNPGQALIYYIVSDFPEKNFTVYRQPRKFTDLQSFKESIHHSYVPDEELPFGLHFSSGKITVDAEQSQFEGVQKELYLKAKTSDQEVLAKIMDIEEKNDQIVAVSHYTNDEWEVYVRSSSKVELYEEMPLIDDELLISKAGVNEHEAFYLKQQTGDFPYQSILWIKDYEGEKMMYEIMNYSLNTVTKEHLIKIAEAVDR